MNNLKFINLEKNNINLCNQFKELMWIYTSELEDHIRQNTPKEVIEKWIDSIINKLGDSDRHLELCYDNNTLIGFIFGKVDHPDHKGYIKIGYGYVMEFFVLKQFRRRKYGTQMFLRLEQLFKKDGINKIYLTADPVTGVPFWEALGFKKTGEILPENNLYIYEKIND